MNRVEDGADQDDRTASATVSNKPDWDKAVAAFERGDLRGALFTFRKISKERPAALVEIGNIYEVGGGGVEQDYLEAKKWYEKSIDTTNDPKAHLALGRLWYFGFGVEQTYEKALYHFGMIEELDEPGALFALGCMYFYGQGVKVDKELANHYMKRSVRLGHLLALREYGRFKIIDGEWLSGLVVYCKAVLKIFVALIKNPGDIRVQV